MASPAPTRPTEHRLTFGYELETIVFGLNQGAAQHAVAEVLNKASLPVVIGPRLSQALSADGRSQYLQSPDSRTFHVEHEVSLQCQLRPARRNRKGEIQEQSQDWAGVEISSPVLRGNKVNSRDRHELEKICRGIRSDLVVQLPASAGTHIHIGLGTTGEAFSHALQARVLTVFYLLEDTIEHLIVAPWRITENTHFRPLKHSVDEYIKNLSDDDWKTFNHVFDEGYTSPKGYFGAELQDIAGARRGDTLGAMWTMDLTELRKCAGQVDERRPNVYINEALATVELRFMAGCLDPKYIEAYINLGLAIVNLVLDTYRTTGSPGDAAKAENASEKLRNLLADVYRLSHLDKEKDLDQAATVLLLKLELESQIPVWAAFKAENQRELDEYRSEGYAPRVPPLERDPNQPAGTIVVGGVRGLQRSDSTLSWRRYR